MRAPSILAVQSKLCFHPVHIVDAFSNDGFVTKAHENFLTKQQGDLTHLKVPQMGPYVIGVVTYLDSDDLWRHTEIVTT